jgi:hypothetical protein
MHKIVVNTSKHHMAARTKVRKAFGIMIVRSIPTRGTEGLPCHFCVDIAP